jgi:hypothetical protein
MKDFIPENILVYPWTIANVERVWKTINAKAISIAEGNTSCRTRQPCKGLYEKLGFTNKYLEMRLIK